METVWTDGACKGNPGPGGWAWATADGRWASGCEARSTNQRMEISAAYEAVRSLPGEVTVVSDSTYVVNCFRDRWWEGWLARGWVNSQRKPVANRDLWEPFVDLYRARAHEIRFQWVKGHSGDAMNDMVDRLAVAAAQTQQPGSGTSFPSDPGPADDVAAAATVTARDRRLPPGRLLGVFGARPPELGGYGDNPVADATRDRLRRIVEAKVAMHRDLHVVSGLRLGVEMLGAEAALAAGVPLVVVRPFPGAESRWSAPERARFERLRGAAVADVLLERKRPESPAKVSGSLRRRDAWLARQVDEAVVVWDGKERFVGQLLKTLHDRLGDDVWEEPVPTP